jgi:hypothetical protein
MTNFSKKETTRTIADTSLKAMLVHRQQATLVNLVTFLFLELGVGKEEALTAENSRTIASALYQRETRTKLRSILTSRWF